MSEKVLMKGNEAVAESAIRAGCKLYFGYPITPQSEIPEYMSRKLPQIPGGAYIQAETEVSAINMVYGATSAGARAMTTSSSPGISLMMEGISYIACAEVPCVIVNVMRGGPGLGNISPEQADYFQVVKGGGHGNYRLVVLAPSSVQEMADLTYEAFDIADKYRTPVMLVAEGNLGQMMEAVEFKELKTEFIDKSDWALTGTKNHDPKIITSILLDPETMEKHIHKLYEKYALIEKNEVKSEEYLTDDAEIIIIAYGLISRVARSVVDKLRDEGIKVGILRPISLWPFPNEAIKSKIKQVDFFFVCEMSMGQMVEDVRLAVNGAKPVHFFGRCGGVVPTPTEMYEAVKKKIKELT